MLRQAVALIRLALRELAGPRTLGRGPMPLSVLGDDGFLDAMETGGRTAGRLAAGFLYHSARITQMLEGRRSCIDLGCGDGTQTIQLAALNPHVRFVGLDRSQRLLDAAARLAGSLGVRNIEWRCDDLPELPATSDAHYDAVISTMTLHDLRDIEEVERALATVNRIATRDAALYIEDFARLKASSSVDCLIRINAPPTPDRFMELYGLSLRAAHTLAELKTAFARRLPQVSVHATAPIPFLLVAKTPDSALSAAQRSRILALHRELQPAARNDLAALRRAFALGGLGNDPFA